MYILELNKEKNILQIMIGLSLLKKEVTNKQIVEFGAGLKSELSVQMHVVFK